MSNQNLNKIEKLINSELSNKIYGSEIKFKELLFKTSVSEIIEVIKFLKLDNRFKFKQLIDIAAIDYPNDEKRFELVYLLLSIENNIMHPYNPFHIYGRQHKKYENNDWFSGKLHLLKCKLVAIIYLLTKNEIHPC